RPTAQDHVLSLHDALPILGGRPRRRDPGRPATGAFVVSGRTDRHAVIVGAGLSGSLMALYLARQGWRVDVYERRGDPRLASAEGRSINLGLSARGIQALAAVGLLDAVLARSVPMRGRYIHTGGPDLAYQPYG